MVASTRYSQAMHFVEPNSLHCTGLFPLIVEDHGFADKLALGLPSSLRIVDARIFAVGINGPHRGTG